MTQMIAVDIGNSAVKFGVFESTPLAEFPRCVRVFQLANESLDFNSLKAELPAASPLFVVSVQRDVERDLAVWADGQELVSSFRVLTDRDLPLRVNLPHPDRVGTDRLAAAVAANALREPNRPAIVVDAGTAITVDLVDGDGTFQGGVILPGTRIAARSLADNTNLLPFADISLSGTPPDIVGKSTQAAIGSGLYWGTVGAVGEVLRRMAASTGDAPQVFVSGGDAERLIANLQVEMRVVPNLVLAGIAIAVRG